MKYSNSRKGQNTRQSLSLGSQIVKDMQHETPKTKFKSSKSRVVGSVIDIFIFRRPKTSSAFQAFFNFDKAPSYVHEVKIKNKFALRKAFKPPVSERIINKQLFFNSEAGCIKRCASQGAFSL